MKSLFKVISMALLAISLAACSRSQATTSLPPTLNPDEVATRVQNLLASVPAQTKIPTQEMTEAPSEITEPPPSPTTVVLSATPPPLASPTSAPSSSPTASVTATALASTATALPSPTISGSDPRPSLGTPTRSDEFTENNFWFPFSDDHTNVVIENGTLSMTALNADGWHSWILTTPTVTNFYLEASAKSGTCEGLDSYGLMLRSPDPTHGYLFGISCDGQFRLEKVSGNDFSDLVKWTANAAIHKGSDQTNRLGVMAKADQFTLYVNGVQVGKATDSDYASGVFGLYIAGYKTNNFTVQVSEVDYWNQP